MISKKMAFKFFMRIVSFGLVSFLIMAQTTFGQEKKIFTFDESMQFALENSYEIINHRQDLERDILNLQGARAALKSHAEMNLDLPAFDESLTQEFNSQKEIYEFYRIKKLTYESNLAIYKPLPTNGTFSLNNNLTSMKQSGNERDYKNRLFLAFTQPLFTPNELMREIRNKEINLERTENNGLRQKMNVIYYITRSFYNVERRKQQLSIDSSDFSAREGIYLKGKQKFGKDEMELLQLEVDYSRSKNRLIRSRGELQREKNGFKQLIGMELTGAIDIRTDGDFKPVRIELEKAIAEGLKNRPEIKNKLLDIELQKLNIEETDSENEFKGHFSSAFGFEKANSSWKGVFKNFDRTRNISLQFSIPVWDWGKNEAEVKAEEYELEDRYLDLQNLKISIERGIKGSFRTLKSAENRIYTLQKSRELAERSFWLALQKFYNGELSAQDIDLSQKRVTNVRRAYIDAFIDYKIALSDLKRKTLFDFEKNSPITELE